MRDGRMRITVYLPTYLADWFGGSLPFSWDYFFICITRNRLLFYKFGGLLELFGMSSLLSRRVVMSVNEWVGED